MNVYARVKNFDKIRKMDATLIDFFFSLCVASSFFFLLQRCFYLQSVRPTLFNFLNTYSICALNVKVLNFGHAG